MFRSFASAEEVVQALEAAAITRSVEYDPAALYGCLADQVRQMEHEKSPTVVGYLIAMGFWNYARQVYADADIAAGNTDSFPESTKYYARLIGMYGAVIVAVLIEADEDQTKVRQCLIDMLQKVLDD